MKNWTLEGPGVGLVLHLVFFSLVLAAVRYSERNAAPSPTPTQSAAAVTAPLAVPPGYAAPLALPVADAMAPHQPYP